MARGGMPRAIVLEKNVSVFFLPNGDGKKFAVMLKIFIHSVNGEIISDGYSANQEINGRALYALASAMICILSGKLIVGSSYGEILQIGEQVFQFYELVLVRDAG